MLKLQYWGHLMQRANSLEKTLMLEKIEGRRRKGWQRMRWLVGIINSMDMSLSKFQEKVDREAGVLQSRGSQRVGHDWVTEWQQQPLLFSWSNLNFSWQCQFWKSPIQSKIQWREKKREKCEVYSIYHSEVTDPIQYIFSSFYASLKKN